MNYFDTLDKTLCCGCTACVSVCPVSCIKMEEDEKGFLYPKIDKSKCIDCGLCKKVCPLAESHSKLLSNELQESCYAYTAHNANVLDASTSGGAFSAIVNGFCNTNDCIVYGAKYNDNFTLEYSYVTDKDNIAVFRKSKYYQSEMKQCYLEIKTFLEKGKKVVFSGTPCHIAGLKSFLSKDYENLLSVDILCFGVPSKKAFLSYKQYLENRYNDKLTSYHFCNKNFSGVIPTFAQNGEKRIKVEKDYYMRAFYAKKMHRDCCSKCQFKREERQGDISIGDFWGIYNTTNKFNLEKGVSLIIFNNPKGKTLLNSFANTGQLEKFDLSCAVDHNQLKKNEWAVDNQFYILLNSGIEFNKVVNKVAPMSNKQRLKLFIFSVMPAAAKNKIKKLIRKTKKKRHNINVAKSNK